MNIRNPRTIRALASPVRLAILDTLEAIGPCPAAEVASLVGLNVDAVYYHLRMLQRLGLVVSGVGKSAPRSGAVFSVPRPLALAYSRDGASASAITKVVGAMLRGALRIFSAAFSTSSKLKGARREVWAAQRFSRLTPSQVGHLNRLLNEIVDLLAEGRDSRKGKLYAFTFVLSPLGPEADA